MAKYLMVLSVSWQNEFIYRLNFILWRVRNIFKFLMVYFLWSGVFMSTSSIYNYNKEQMLSYVFLVLVVTALVFSSHSSGSVGGEISRGDLGNYLVKPVSYLGYWLSRDLSTKLLNIIFSFLEVFLLWLIFKPVLYLHTNPFNIFLFVSILVAACLIFFLMSFIVSLTSFWMPANVWPAIFLLSVLTDILSGGIFPLDILPEFAKVFLQFTPFPYLLYYPIAALLGKLSFIEGIRILAQAIAWVVCLYWLSRLVWSSGLKNYSSEGK